MISSVKVIPPNVSDVRALYCYRSPYRSISDENKLVERVEAGIISSMRRAGVFPCSETGAEIRQRAWVYVLDRLDGYLPTLGALTTWTYFQTQAVIKSWFREIHRTPAPLKGFDRVHPQGERGSRDFEMRDLLQILPESERELIEKVVVNGMSVRAVAALTGVSHTHVYGQLRRILATLRHQMVG